MASSTPLVISADKERGLKRYNQIAGLFHAIQAIALKSRACLPYLTSLWELA